MRIDFQKYKDGLVPAIVQDFETQQVLMLGFMNEKAYEATKKGGHVTFYSRSKERLWTKGEESGNFLELVSLAVDCDSDTLLVQARPKGPVCHTGTGTCWGAENRTKFGFLTTLEGIIQDRKENVDKEDSYVSSLFRSGINKIAQKVGEEAVEVVIEAKDDDASAFLNEGADLLFHYLILLKAKGFGLKDIEETLKKRHL
ncbi:bifunctional phosphoribosyl-AMP cyclohydrolase/phosphoribosyl-ATP diphosphatase HisIE [Altibacter lentus]|uniref:bifunctional phosphoribosyl-AMP cyclohydrolase/phosphoribosyl-ATP diphosphatase HisIE n=1 Tax=Altibacter lentus TaxID=1223410 RepID=UPI00054DD71F|nr:bifunctional phosphoribosyl-AMP cyclohydrolase/phosphoribosyl-ATP diphosphatase HisIE [Altibacter lentus]